MAARAIPSPAPALRAGWRRLRTMRTAIVLLLVLAAGASVGSFFPQRPINPQTAAEWVRRNPGFAPVAERLGLLDVYGSWWFMGIYALLVVSLVGCLVPRYRAFWRALRARPRATAAMAQQRHYHAGTVALAPDAALSGAERVLRDRRFRLTRENGTLAAEKGHLREGGSLVFHTAFLVLLVGISVGKLYGYSGQVALVEGDTFRDTRIEYDSIATGRYFPGHTGMTIALDDFDVSWYGNGIPRDFVSKVRLGDGRREVRAQAIRVNHPLRYGGVRAYQLSWGWAPVIRVAQRGRVLYDGPTVFLTQGGAWRGVIKTPSSRPLQMGLDMLFVPDPQVDAEGNPASGGPEPNDPLLVFQQYLGDLGLDVPQSVYALDPTRLAPGEVGAMRMGETRVLKHGIEVSFTGLKQYSVFQVSSNPGAPVLLIAGILILVGLIPALYSSRRRVWVRAAGSDGVARLEIAGQALQRKAAFEEEFRTLVRTIDRDLMSRIGHG